MEPKNWSSFIVRTLVLIAGMIVILEAVHVLSISVTLHTLSSEVRNNHNLPEIVAGMLVGSLALIPARRNKPRRVPGPVPLRWSGINSVDSRQHLMLLANFTTRLRDIR